MTKLSKNFTLEEFTRSQTATRKGIENIPGEKETEQIQKLTDNVLQPLRDALGPVYISSGFRCEKLNKAIGGVSKYDPATGKRIVSQHVKGQAADIIVTGHSVEDVFNYIADNLPFDQLIYEFGSWVHVSFSEGKNRKEMLEAYKLNGKTKYRTISRA